jgi:type IV fimbrial biogenesis protein FimT
MSQQPGSTPTAARGFTLVELVIVMALFALVASLAAPSMQRLVAAQQLRSASYDLISDLTLARSEAVKRGAQVSITPTSGTDWATGYTIQTVAGATPLGQRKAMPHIAVTPSPASVIFDAQGTVFNVTSTVQIGLADAYGRVRCISIDPAGRPKSKSSACS